MKRKFFVTASLGLLSACLMGTVGAIGNPMNSAMERIVKADAHEDSISSVSYTTETNESYYSEDKIDSSIATQQALESDLAFSDGQKAETVKVKGWKVFLNH